MPLPSGTTTIDLPRMRGVILDALGNHLIYTTAFDTEVGIFGIELHPARVWLKIAHGSTSVSSGRVPDLNAAVAACARKARKRGIDPIVWLLTNPTTPDPT